MSSYSFPTMQRRAMTPGPLLNAGVFETVRMPHVPVGRDEHE